MIENKRKIELVVLSDIHLGTYGCQAKEVLRYLKGIKPERLILNGDIIDIWQFSKRFWPNSHMKVVKQIIGMTAKGTQVYYVTGNHDETLRKFAGTKMGNLELVNKLELNVSGTRMLFFHGDVFDVIMKHSKWIAKLGAIGYNSLIQINVLISFFSKLLGRRKVSISRRIKDNVKSAVKYINNFEETVANYAIQKGFDYVICGHIHHPEIREISNTKGKKVTYLNSGDWIENLSALEYNKKKWSIYYYNQDEKMKNATNENDDHDGIDMKMKNKELFKLMVKEFQD